jgi:hypothetical protein
MACPAGDLQERRADGVCVALTPFSIRAIDKARQTGGKPSGIGSLSCLAPEVWNLKSDPIIPFRCVEKDSLLTDYQRTVRRYSDAITQLNGLAIATKQEYDRLYRIAEDVRLSVEHVRLSLEQHVSVHGC